MEENWLIQELASELVDADNDSPKRSCAMDLLLAIETQPFDQVKDLIKAKKRSIQLMNVGYKALVKAMELRKTDLANCLLDHSCRVNLEKKVDTPSTTPLHLAVQIGDPVLVDRILAAGASIIAIDEKGNTPLHLAFLCKNEEIIDEILMAIQKRSAYANMRNGKGLTHMHIACARKNFVVIKRFLEQSTLTISPARGKKKIHRKKIVVKEEC